MKKRAVVGPAQERQKSQVIPCPCCKTRLALHFIHSKNEVYDVEFVGTTDLSPSAAVADQSRLDSTTGEEEVAECKRDELQDNIAVEVATDTRGSNSKTYTAPSSVSNQLEMQEQVIKRGIP